MCVSGAGVSSRRSDWAVESVGVVWARVSVVRGDGPHGAGAWDLWGIGMIRLFRHYVPLPLLMLALVEASVFFWSIPLGKFARSWSEGWIFSVEGLFGKAFVFMLVMVSIMTAMGLYERNFWDGKADMMLRVAVGFLLGLFTITLIYYFFPDLYLGRGEFGIAFTVSFLLVTLARYGFFHLSDHDMLKRRVLLLGCGRRARQIEQLSNGREGKGFKIIGFVRLNEGDEVAVDADRLLPVQGTLRDLAEAQQIDEIVVAMEDRRRGFPVDQILDCKISGFEVTDLSTFFERETGKIQLDSLHPSAMIFSDGFHQAALKTVSKRLIDVVSSLLLLGLTWPIMLVTALAIWIESGGRGPIFYRQTRVGRHDRVFEVIKFRSMRTDAEKDGVAQWAQKNDSRVTRVGAFIRKTRIDELPQLFNVLRGEMSFVGPRPERPQFVAELSQSIPYYSMRHRVNPGITGWAQICYPYGASEEDAREKLQYDLYYIKNYSVFLDLMVLLQTAHVILWGKGAR